MQREKRKHHTARCVCDGKEVQTNQIYCLFLRFHVNWDFFIRHAKRLYCLSQFFIRNYQHHETPCQWAINLHFFEEEATEGGREIQLRELDCLVLAIVGVLLDPVLRKRNQINWRFAEVAAKCAPSSLWRWCRPQGSLPRRISSARSSQFLWEPIGGFYCRNTSAAIPNHLQRQRR